MTSSAHPELAYPSALDVDFLRWSEVAVGEAAESGRTIEDVLGHRHDGFVVTGVLDADEVSRVSGTFRDHVDEWHPVGYGGTWAFPVGTAWDGNRAPYYDRAERARDDYRSVFGFDITERLVRVFSSLSGHYDVVVADEDGRDYLPGSFREMEAGGSGLPAHTGNEFFEIGADGPLIHLRAVTRYINSLSWFILIEQPEVGGELRLYDLKYDERPDLRGFNNFDREDSPFEELPTASLRPAPGDLVWFRGGDQWHKVAPIKGQRSRVTFGGFMAPMLDDEQLVFWS